MVEGVYKPRDQAEGLVCHVPEHGAWGDPAGASRSVSLGQTGHVLLHPSPTMHEGLPRGEAGWGGGLRL